MNEPLSLSVADDELALLTDLYQLTMTQAYWKEGVHETPATFSLFFRKLPSSRRFILACGQQHAAATLSQLRFNDTAIKKLASTGRFEDDFLSWLSNWRFSGDIWAVPEGTPLFPHQPLLEVDAPIAEAQLLESLVMNLVQVETVLASKAARIVWAAGGRPVVDFGMRRVHGIDAAVRGVRAYKTAGLSGTSNVLGGLRHDLPLNGTMAHSYILAHDDEPSAFRAFAGHYPNTTLLVDTYDTLQGVRHVIDMLRETPNLSVGAVRLDSGDLGTLAKSARALLDDAGFTTIKIIASSGLDEHGIAELIAQDAPIDAFGVGTQMGVSADAPVIDLSYKLVEYAGKPRAKHSPGKLNLPTRKQVYRHQDAAGQYIGDTIAQRDETGIPGEALLRPVVQHGVVVPDAMAQTQQATSRVADALPRFPASVTAIEKGESDYPVKLSDALKHLSSTV
ncbi:MULTISPECIES: nicotinate phosphoribosyltransferase [unclassified Halomonas]|uniref:nicotinate phosphoribosyltransferase n=1 Tax=unclassified Halomonas TaxID=2609666 RepID=UPI0006DB4613|nr:MULTISPECIES: nicotinate phosphoribosyltransferase [unclassified Halomonas]KPQ23906.1 MAG: nicotinate phosphoribosyltransferase PcnB [Halomonas sp. HL-93]SBR46632.1 nicotinate phosphoribosyltransferase [Halomonas sp. HL-93]SNY98840.1 nicotinate phosphoribosyltransferase [Halomonas sp. hl-4]